MIGYAKEKEGLYFVEEQGSGQEPRLAKISPMTCMTESSQSRRENIWLQHFHFGHTSFNVLKIMYFLLFKGLNELDFQCDTCEFAKHRRTYFPMNVKRSPPPLTLIHNDIWGPSPITNIIGTQWFVSFINDCTRTT